MASRTFKIQTAKQSCRACLAEVMMSLLVGEIAFLARP